ncbi:uncharacterized protein METZ01_LOCUS52574 [marine metagenome]|uniref:Baseplate tail tube cap n=1 Tax=marine metagenome TaxID=408172 RepID=A0A381S6N5_9ZZZZ
MVNPIRQVVSGQLQQFGKGVIRGLLGKGRSKGRGGKSSDNSPTTNLAKISKFTTTNVAYPSAVESPDQGHWILFNINSMTSAKLRKQSSAGAASFKKINDLVNKEFKIRSPSGDPALNGQLGAGITRVDVAGRSIKDFSGQGGGATVRGAPSVKTGGMPGGGRNSSSTNLYAATNNITRLDTTIALYMPASVQASYSLEYENVPIGAMGQAIVGVFDSIVKVAQGTSIKDAGFGGALSNAEEGVKRMALSSIDAIMPGIRAQAQIKEGKILSNKMELSFNGVGRRQFSFSFVFMPKSEKEALTVEHICYLFKYHSHPRYVEDRAGRQMTIPDSFDIRYMYQDQQNHFLNKISTCFLENVSVAYGGDRFVAYRPTTGLHGAGAPPQRTTLTLQFKELEIITQERIEEGF